MAAHELLVFINGQSVCAGPDGFTANHCTGGVLLEMEDDSHRGSHVRWYGCPGTKSRQLLAVKLRLTPEQTAARTAGQLSLQRCCSPRLRGSCGVVAAMARVRSGAARRVRRARAFSRPSP